MRLATRLFVATSLLVAATVAGLIIAADQILRRELVSETQEALAGEARLVALQLPRDSSRWSDAAHTIGALTGHRVTLIDPTGRVRGDTDFPPDALPHLENHAHRPEVLQALAQGEGSFQRLSASTNERQLYVAVRGGPPGIAIVRVSATLASVDDQVAGVQRAVALAGVGALGAAAILAWLLARSLARPLVELTATARAIAEDEAPAFPDSRVPEVAEHIRALRTMSDRLAQRFGDLRREREESRTLVESMTDGVIAADARGVIVACNTAARRLLGRSADEVLPGLGLLFHEKGARELVRDVLAGHEVDQREIETAGRVLLGTGRMLPDGGTLLVFRDVTALRRLELVRRDFVANVSHELKTPLTSIAGYAETLAGESAPESQTHKFAETILANARRMQRLVEDLLDLSRIESGGWRPAPQVEELAPAAREAWAPFADRAAARDVRFAVEVPPAAHAAAADPEALRQIFTNLFDNALRHTPPGGRITVAAAQVPDGIVVTVADTGTGIPPEHLPRIFERFYRADPARSRDQGGTGLGLAIVKHLVEAQGGRVDAESPPRQGATIRFVLPPSVPRP
ncbi:MAG TPA: ATP-binding protein [Gemmatimonadales bacterium]|nr:ATP-binding protein [Gemmatimonadales bacterium]